MPKFAANLTMLFNEVPFLDRFALAAQAGFEAVEFLFPYAFPAHEIRRRLGFRRLDQDRRGARGRPHRLGHRPGPRARGPRSMRDGRVSDK